MTKMRGARELHMKLGRIGRAAVAEARVALMRGAHRVQNRAVQGIIDPPKTGKTYPSRGRKGAPHKASAPGEFPAADTGELHQSITTAENSSHAITRFEVGANVEYAAHLGPAGALVRLLRNAGNSDSPMCGRPEKVDVYPSPKRDVPIGKHPQDHHRSDRMPKLTRWERMASSCLSKRFRMRCEAMTRAGGSCQAPAMPNGRCKLHGGCSTGPLSQAGRDRIAAAQRRRWDRWRAERIADVDG